MSESKPFAQACENNKEPILVVLLRHLDGLDMVLEIGSGTGQHAVHMARHLPHLSWQTSDLAHQHAGICAWIEDSGLSNVVAPLELDVNATAWPCPSAPAIYSANTAHILSWGSVQAMFAGVSRTLATGGLFALYGPFNYGGIFTSPGNRRLDQSLKAHDSLSGIRDFEALDELAQANRLHLIEDNEMPANNRLLIWRAQTA
ncbi:MAG: DUF938 domain-containing protein [Proteobacteria bacterium]|nr:MAG: DUF938 domain-containing protein [Pseudomonadota bacterium]